ncbi:hypothetical protein GCM10009558_079600 [Virgisporangium aurantiacum]
MDARTPPRSRSKATATRVGAVGAALLAGSAFLALGAGTASAAPADAATVARPADVQVKADCFTPMAVSYDYTKSCGGGAYVIFHFLGSSSCGVGGQGAIYRFARGYYSAATGPVTLPQAQTPCA